MEGALECGLGVEPELDSVAEANIDDDAHACSGDFSIGLHAEPAIFEFPADQVHGEARCVERHAVVHLDGADLAEDRGHGSRIWIAETEKSSEAHRLARWRERGWVRE